MLNILQVFTIYSTLHSGTVPTERKDPKYHTAVNESEYGKQSNGTVCTSKCHNGRACCGLEHENFSTFALIDP